MENTYLKYNKIKIPIELIGVLMYFFSVIVWMIMVEPIHFLKNNFCLIVYDVLVRLYKRISSSRY